MKKKRSFGSSKRKFLHRWKRRVKGNIEKCPKQWASHMDELKERNAEYGLTAKTFNNLRNEHINSSQTEFEHRNVWLGDTGASAHMTMVQAGFKTLKKGQVKTCFAVDGNEVEAQKIGEWKG